MTLDLTLEYKKTEEYKLLYQMVKEINPKMPDYLVDLVIYAHKTDPYCYRNDRKNKNLQVPPKPTTFEINAVNVLDPVPPTNTEPSSSVVIEEVSSQ